MFNRRSAVVLLVAAAALAGCGKTDPQASLEAAVQRLQDNLEAKKTSAVLDQLHDRFRAQGSLDRDWARQTMTVMFLRYANIRVVAVTRNSRIDPAAPQKGYTDAQVLVTGAQGLIPDEAAPYGVTLEWQLDGIEWKLFDLQWK